MSKLTKVKIHLGVLKELAKKIKKSKEWSYIKHRCNKIGESANRHLANTAASFGAAAIASSCADSGGGNNDTAGPPETQNTENPDLDFEYERDPDALASTVEGGADTGGDGGDEGGACEGGEFELDCDPNGPDNTAQELPTTDPIQAVQGAAPRGGGSSGSPGGGGSPSGNSLDDDQEGAQAKASPREASDLLDGLSGTSQSRGGYGTSDYDDYDEGASPSTSATDDGSGVRNLLRQELSGIRRDRSLASSTSESQVGSSIFDQDSNSQILEFLCENDQNQVDCD